MKKSLTILFYLVLSTLTAQEYRIEYGNKRFMNYHYHCSHDNGFTLKKKLKDGTYKVYLKTDPDVIVIEGQYENRKKNGEWTIYNPYEKSFEYQTFENGVLKYESGIDSLGRETLEIIHKPDSVFHTIYSYDYPVNSTGVARCIETGTEIKKTKTYISTSTCYYPDETLNRIYRYKNGDSHGKCVKYYSNGQVKMEFENWNGEKVGIWRWYDEDGTLTKETDYGGKN